LRAAPVIQESKDFDMISLDKLVGLNIEVSSICNAKCPFCSRNKKVRTYDTHLIRLADFKRLPKSFLRHLEWVAFGGNFGDLAANNDMPQMAEYAKQLNHKVQLHGDTNGSLQKASWWHELGLHYQDGFMVFSLDGLDDTHAIHRRGTDFQTIVKNTRAFAGAGGVAYWKFILFEHNEHQIRQAEKIAEDIGCTRFFVVSSREYNGECRRPQSMQFELKKEIDTRYQAQVLSENGFARCKPFANQSIYIAADGTVHPCCLAHCMYITEYEPSFKFAAHLIQDHLDRINFKTRPLEKIIQGAYFKKMFKLSKTNSYCISKCNKYKKEARQELILYDRYF